MINLETCQNCQHILPLGFNDYICTEPLNQYNVKKPFDGKIKFLELEKTTCKFWKEQ